MPRNGVGALVISPTRELAMQIYGVVREVMKFHSQTHGLVIGGANRGTEADKLGKVWFPLFFLLLLVLEDRVTCSMMMKYKVPTVLLSQSEEFL